MSKLPKSEAYNKYFEYTIGERLPATKAIKKVAEDCGVSERSIYNWRTKYKWDAKCTERSIKINRELAKDIETQANNNVKDFKRPFISILNRLIKQCVNNHQVEIKTPKELVIVMETVLKLEKELDMNNVNIISSDYSREKHTKAINSLLKELQEENIYKMEEKSNTTENDVNEDGLPKSANIETG